MSNPTLKILLLSSEVSPFVKTGGIADVVSELARALKGLGHDVRVALPRYRVIQTNGSPRVLESFPVHLDGLSENVSVIEGKLADNVPVYFIDNPRHFDREDIYMHPDDAERFLLFSRAALEMFGRPPLFRTGSRRSTPTNPFSKKLRRFIRFTTCPISVLLASASSKLQVWRSMDLLRTPVYQMKSIAN